MKHLTLAAAMALLSAPAFAQVSTQGDAAAGEEVFARNCVACHVVQNGDEVLAGRNSKTGPNLYQMPGRTPGTYEGFEYGDSMIAFGATGAVWDEAHFVAYVQDPTGYLREQLDDNRARGKMAFQLRKEEDAYNVYAYLVQLSAPAAQ
ncbi:MAG: c-type cytochrome [Rhodobacterales bacterium]|jgi:cytochrome c|nr:c-type cytochrome [Rhodobacterales bacterium]